MSSVKRNIAILPMQEYLIGVHDYIGLLMAYIGYMYKVDAPENPSHYH
tara:strand:- start:393 stop:536 length:144 start_codon:yes stop_codon:yes gene_type:complete